MDVTSSMSVPSLALFMVVDKSGSMGDTIAGGESKLDLVKEAVVASIEVLNPFYTIALLAFDADFEWTVDPTNAGSKEPIIGDLAGLKSGGGTKLFPALEEAHKKLLATPAAVKHMLILSDGLTDEGDFQSLAKGIRADRITVSTVAVGSDSDQKLLAQIAELGGGRSYFTDDIKRIPKIFASESLIVSRGLIVEEPFLPIPGVPHEVTGGIDLMTIPPLKGFVLSYPKAGAQHILTAYNNNPLLSAWRHGLGRTAAYTSDFTGKWGIDLLGWSDFPQFSAQLIRWLKRPTGALGLQVELTNEHGEGAIVVDAVDEQGDFINYLSIEGILLAPGKDGVQIAIEQIAPGRYEYRFAADDPGDYYATLFTTGDSLSFGPKTYGMTIPYSTEFLRFQPDRGLLQDVARITGGSVLSTFDIDADLELLYSNEEAGSREYQDLWRYLVIAALFLFLVDIAIRQLMRKREDEMEEKGGGVARRIRTGVEARIGQDFSYNELITRLQRERRREKERQRELSYWFGAEKEDPDTSLRLYLARKKRE